MKLGAQSWAAVNTSSLLDTCAVFYISLFEVGVSTHMQGDVSDSDNSIVPCQP